MTPSKLPPVLKSMSLPGLGEARHARNLLVRAWAHTLNLIGGIVFAHELGRLGDNTLRCGAPRDVEDMGLRRARQIDQRSIGRGHQGFQNCLFPPHS